jgi:uncharacterized protein YbjQ (UPF0145 family)
VIEIGIAAVLLVLGYFVGGAREKKHFEDLKRREAIQLRTVAVRTDPGPELKNGETFLVTASVVVASDYFKNFVGTFRNILGGRLLNHESLLDRARREALCRLREKAANAGAYQIVDVHLETNFLDQMGAEVSAYGTAVKA